MKNHAFQRELQSQAHYWRNNVISNLRPGTNISRNRAVSADREQSSLKECVANNDLFCFVASLKTSPFFTSGNRVTAAFKSNQTREQKITDPRTLGISLGESILELTPKAKEAKANINKWNYIKLKIFIAKTKTINKVKNIPYRMWKYLQIIHLTMA